MSDKKYPLDVENVGSDTYIVMSRGHHDIHEFMTAVRLEGYTWPLGVPEHRWAKAVPDRSEQVNYRYCFVDKNIRGAFPVTYAWEAYGEERYEAVFPDKAVNNEVLA